VFFIMTGNIVRHLHGSTAPEPASCRIQLSNSNAIGCCLGTVRSVSPPCQDPIRPLLATSYQAGRQWGSLQKINGRRYLPFQPSPARSGFLCAPRPEKSPRQKAPGGVYLCNSSPGCQGSSLSRTSSSSPVLCKAQQEARSWLSCTLQQGQLCISPESPSASRCPGLI